jgi:hypothetical protein
MRFEDSIASGYGVVIARYFLARLTVRIESRRQSGKI